MALLLMLIVGGLIAAAAIAAFIVLMVRLSDEPKLKPNVPHAWQTPPAPTSAPGWYADLSDPNVVRYFDGRAWTSATRSRLDRPGP